MKRAVIAGSFDPFTIGHKDLYDRASEIFDEVLIGVAVCSNKKVLDAQKRVEIIKAYLPNAKVKIFDGLLTDFMKNENINYLVRGIRNTIDFEYEKNLDAAYKSINDIEILYMIPPADKMHVSSTIVRELLKAGGDISKLVDTKAENLIRSYYIGGFNEDKSHN